MKNFKKFLEEVTIKGNPGVPGEGERQPEDSNYLSDLERDQKQKLGVTGREFPMGMQRLGGRIMQLVGQSQQMMRGKERELEQLAHDVIMSNYEDILDGVKLDIKFATPREVQDNLDCEGGDCDLPELREIEDEDLIKRIHKAKLSNNIIQGEAKNTKHIIHSDEVKSGLEEIFGNNWQQIFEIWDEISKIADKMDWIIPINIKSDMMENHPEGMAGSVQVDWQPKPEKDYTPKEDDDELKDEQEPELELEGDEPVIRARGVDFPMLLHETVKGIYELIAAISQPAEGSSEKEVEDAETVKMNVSSFADEAEDFRTGPQIASNLRDFINKAPNSDYNQNVREFVFGKMMDEEYMTPDEFLKLFRGILNETDEARQKIDSMVGEIVQELKNYNLGDLAGNDYTPEPVKPNTEPEEDKEVDYSKMSQRDLNDLINNALDDSDFETVKKLSQYLKEGKEIYLKELEMINAKHSYHRK